MTSLEGDEFWVGLGACHIAIAYMDIDIDIDQRESVRGVRFGFEVFD